MHYLTPTLDQARVLRRAIARELQNTYECLADCEFAHQREPFKADEANLLDLEYATKAAIREMELAEAQEKDDA